MQTFNLGQTQPSSSLSQALNQNLVLESGFNLPAAFAKQGFATGLASVASRQAASRKLNETMSAQMKLYNLAAKQKAAEMADQRAYQEAQTQDERDYKDYVVQSQRDYEQARLEDEREYKHGIDMENIRLKQAEADKADAETVDALQAQLMAMQEGMTSVAGAYKPNSEQQRAVLSQIANIARARAQGGGKGRLAGYLKGITDSGFSSGFNVGALGTASAKPAIPSEQNKKPVDPYSGWSNSHLSN